MELRDLRLALGEGMGKEVVEEEVEEEEEDEEEGPFGTSSMAKEGLLRDGRGDAGGFGFSVVMDFFEMEDVEDDNDEDDEV